MRVSKSALKVMLFANLWVVATNCNKENDAAFEGTSLSSKSKKGVSEKDEVLNETQVIIKSINASLKKSSKGRTDEGRRFLELAKVSAEGLRSFVSSNHCSSKADGENNEVCIRKFAEIYDNLYLSKTDLKSYSNSLKKIDKVFPNSKSIFVLQKLIRAFADNLSDEKFNEYNEAYMAKFNDQPDPPFLIHPKNYLTSLLDLLANPASYCLADSDLSIDGADSCLVYSGLEKVNADFKKYIDNSQNGPFIGNGYGSTSGTIKGSMDYYSEINNLTVSKLYSELLVSSKTVSGKLIKAK